MHHRPQRLQYICVLLIVNLGQACKQNYSKIEKKKNSFLIQVQTEGESLFICCESKNISTTVITAAINTPRCTKDRKDCNVWSPDCQSLSKSCKQNYSLFALWRGYLHLSQSVWESCKNNQKSVWYKLQKVRSSVCVWPLVGVLSSRK